MIEAAFFCIICKKTDEHKIFYLLLRSFLIDPCIKKQFIT